VKRLLLVALIISFVITLQAQTPIVTTLRDQTPQMTYGIGAGLNISNMTYKPAPGFYNGIYPEWNPGFSGYIFLGLPLNKKYWIQMELGYYGLGSKIDNKSNGFNFQNETTGMNYLTLAVLPKLIIKKSGLAFLIGPSMAYKLSSTASLSGSVNPNDPIGGIYANNDYKSFEVFGILGLQYDFPAGLGISARYMQGLVNVAGDSYGDAKVFNHAFTFSVSYRFTK
jgi:Outer membrane protein beta-barrel domain